MIKDLFLDYHAITAYLCGINNQLEIKTGCELLNWFWSTHCEVTKTYFYLITFTSRDDEAVKLWKDLNKKLNEKIYQIGELHENFRPETSN